MDVGACARRDVPAKPADCRVARVEPHAPGRVPLPLGARRAGRPLQFCSSTHWPPVEARERIDQDRIFGRYERSRCPGHGPTSRHDGGKVVVVRIDDHLRRSPIRCRRHNARTVLFFVEMLRSTGQSPSGLTGVVVRRDAKRRRPKALVRRGRRRAEVGEIEAVVPSSRPQRAEVVACWRPRAPLVRIRDTQDRLNGPPGGLTPHGLPRRRGS